MRRLFYILAVLVGTISTVPVNAISVPDYTVQVSARVQANPPQITLAWPADPDATSYTLYRKTRDATAWGTGTSLATNATSYVDSNVTVGVAYEYQITKTASENGSYYTGYGYIYAGIQASFADVRGKVLLLVDNTVTNALAFELNRLQLDLMGDGWSVIRRDVNRASTPPQVKAIITNEYNADPVNLKSVFLLGHVPVPYSGLMNPDGHGDHLGAWPADVYYGDMNGTWTDTSISNITAGRVENRNVPGDGKFDQTVLPSPLELQVGRVDLWNMPAFPKSETELLRQYLNKEHDFRMRYNNPPRRALVDDNFGTFGGEAFAASSYRSFAPFFGYTNIIAGDWFTTLATSSYLWGYACGGGGYTSEGGVGSTANFVQGDTRVIFTMHFGSYFGDYDVQNNLMRAQLANSAGGLSCAWAGRPHWYFHHMALGEPIGFSALMSENYTGYGLYSPANYGTHNVHVNLLGDPTLRLHMVAPPSALVITENGAGGRDLRWQASPDTVLGYLVYGAATAAGPFYRLTENPLGGTSFTDPAPSNSLYMVRAVKLETSASGTYTNLSQGIFENVAGTFSPPSLALTQPTNGSIFSIGNAIPLGVTTSDANNDIVEVDYFTNGVYLGASTVWPYALSWSNAWLGTYAVSALARDAAGYSVTSGVINVTITYATTSLVPTGSVWKYFDLGDDLGTSWRLPDYDDSTWSSGPGQLGFGDNDEATVVNTNRARITTYFRKSFVPPVNGMCLGATVRLLRDDGGVVYLNGTEVFRSNMPSNQPIVWATQASANALTEDESTKYYAAPVSLALLRPGTNLLAVEIHQYGTNSSDLSFDLELLATNLPAVFNTPPQISSISDQVTDEDVSTPAIPFTVEDHECWAEGVTVALSSSNPNLVSPANAVFTGSGSNRFLTITPAANQSGTALVTLTASDGLASNSASFTLTVNPVPDAPSLAWVGVTNWSTLAAGLITLNAGAIAPDSTLVAVEYFVNGAKIGQATTAPFTFVWSNAPSGYYTLQARAIDNAGLSATSSVFVRVMSAPMTLVNAGQVWKYWDRGQSLTNWHLPGYDDSAWPGGPSPLGYADANGIFPATTNSYGPDINNKYITTYYRCAFTVANAARMTNLFLSIQRDDGAVIYLNGVEVYRNNLPSGAINFSTLASVAIGGTDETAWYSTNLASASLLTGTNILAAEIHQSGPTSTDIFFNLKLTANLAPQPPVLQPFQAEGVRGVSWPSWAADFSLWSATNLIEPVTWVKVTNGVSGVGDQIRFTPSSNAQKSRFYQLRSW